MAGQIAFVLLALAALVGGLYLCYVVIQIHDDEKRGTK